VNKYGFIETPFRRVRDGSVQTRWIYPLAMEEAKYNVAQANAGHRRRGHADGDLVICRRAGDDIVGRA
jgi:DNA-directed RNA polymerase subunit beta